eukprot:TRINITY_DN979_c2_g3_i1.p1 TRINITY_DN979_c2_g3~~TRINITY_DN979_c2_g3_i1.p1  ORF type:complete len:1038 (+),score=144.45 TRINITY_DN979_c2_g3_i1:37-3114(+)
MLRDSKHTVAVSEHGNTKRRRQPTQFSTNYASMETFAAAVIAGLGLTKPIKGFYSTGGGPILTISNLRDQKAVQYVLSGTRTRSRSPTAEYSRHNTRNTYKRVWSSTAPNPFKLKNNRLTGSHPAPRRDSQNFKKPVPTRGRAERRLPSPRRLSIPRTNGAEQVSYISDTPGPSSQDVTPICSARAMSKSPFKVSPIPPKSLYSIASPQSQPGSSRVRSSTRSYRAASPESARRSVSGTSHRSRSAGGSRRPKKPQKSTLLSLYSPHLTRTEIDNEIKNGKKMITGVLRINTWNDEAAYIDTKEVITSNEGTVCSLMVPDSTSCQYFCPKRNRALPGDTVVVEYDDTPVPECMASGLRWDDRCPESVIIGSVVSIKTRATTETVFAIAGEDAGLDPEAVDGYGVVVPLNNAYPKLLMPVGDFEQLNLSQRPTIAVNIHQEWSIISRLPVASLVGVVGSSSESPFLVEERIILAELGRIKFVPATPRLEPDDEFHTEFLAELTSSSQELLTDIDNGTIKDLRESCRPFVLSPSSGVTDSTAFSCSELDESGTYRIGVHVLDVGSLIREGSSLDKLLRRRLSTIVLPHVIHKMFPAIVQTRLSLEAGVPRKCFSIMWTATVQDATPQDVWCGLSAISARCCITEHDFESILLGSPHLAVPITGTTQLDNPVHILSEVKGFIACVGDRTSCADLIAPRQHVRKLYRLAMGAEDAIDPLQEMTFRNSLPPPGMSRIRGFAEELANKIIIKYMQPIAPIGVIPHRRLIKPAGVAAAAAKLPIHLSVFHSETSPKILRSRLWSRGSSTDLLRDWEWVKNSELSTHITSPFDRYTDIVIQRIISRMIKSHQSELQPVKHGDIVVSFPSMEQGMGPWKPSALQRLLDEDARHEIKCHTAYDSMLTTLNRLILHQSRGRYIRIVSEFIGVANDGLVGLRIPDWGVVKWFKLKPFQSFEAEIRTSTFDEEIDDGAASKFIEFSSLKSPFERTQVKLGGKLILSFHPTAAVGVSLDTTPKMAPPPAAGEEISVIVT